MSIIQINLRLPADDRMLPLIEDYGQHLGRLAGLPEDQADALGSAVEEACRNSIARAFAGGEPGTLKLVGEMTPTILILFLRDQGLPFWQPLEDAPLTTPERPASAGLTIQDPATIHQVFDQVRWSYHGVQGNELRLTKNLAGVCRLPVPEPEISGPRTEAVQAEAHQAYTIRLLQPGDGIHLARLIYRVYGYRYSRADFYYPDRLDQDLATGRLLGVVAVTADGEIAGHAGLERPDPGLLGELIALAVAPAHRGQGLYKLMDDRLRVEIKRLGLIGLFAEAITSHTISQEGCDNRGFHVTGLKFQEWQGHFQALRHPYANQREPEAEPGIQRQTLVFYFKYLAPPGPLAVCVPSRHREMLAKIYRNLEVDLEFLEPSSPTEPGELQVHYNQTTYVGIIQVNRIGRDTLPEIHQARRDLCDVVGAKVVGLLLPLAQVGMPYLCEAAEAEGFFFSGVQPKFAQDGDFLRLQYLNADLDPARIHLSSPFAKELLDYILREKERCRQ